MLAPAAVGDHPFRSLSSSGRLEVSSNANLYMLVVILVLTVIMMTGAMMSNALLEMRLQEARVALGAAGLRSRVGAIDGDFGRAKRRHSPRARCAVGGALFITGSIWLLASLGIRVELALVAPLAAILLGEAFFIASLIPKGAEESGI